MLRPKTCLHSDLCVKHRWSTTKSITSDVRHIRNNYQNVFKWDSENQTRKLWENMINNKIWSSLWLAYDQDTHGTPVQFTTYTKCIGPTSNLPANQPTHTYPLTPYLKPTYNLAVRLRVPAAYLESTRLLPTSIFRHIFYPHTTYSLHLPHRLHTTYFSHTHSHTLVYRLTNIWPKSCPQPTVTTYNYLQHTVNILIFTITSCT